MQSACMQHLLVYVGIWSAAAASGRMSFVLSLQLSMALDTLHHSSPW